MTEQDFTFPGHLTRYRYPVVAFAPVVEPFNGTVRKGEWYAVCKDPSALIRSTPYCVIQVFHPPGEIQEVFGQHVGYRNFDLTLFEALLDLAVKTRLTRIHDRG